MDAYSHLTEAAKHLRLAAARFPKDSKGTLMPAYHYPRIVKLMLRLDALISSAIRHKKDTP